MVSTPNGTYGLAVKLGGDIYAVAADWAHAASPVLVFGEDGWTSAGHQVADYRHDKEDALRSLLQDAIEASGDECDDALLDRIMARASAIDSE